MLFLVLSGTLLRLIFGIFSKDWMAAPDQLAWGLSLDEMMQSGTFSYKQLIHYPHEGGSLIVSIVAICLRPFNFILPSLSLSALLIDTISRWIQIKLVQKMFGTVTMSWFALWTVLAVPLLLPWATVNFGLHSLSAFLPFIFIYFATVHISKMPGGFWCGLVAGLSVSFSYDNLIFIPTFLIWKLFDSGKLLDKFRTMGMFLSIALIAMIPHMMVRFFADNGFQLEQLSSTSIRGVAWGTVLSLQSLQNLVYVLQNHLPASFFLSTTSLISEVNQRFIVIGFFIVAIIFSFLAKVKSNKSF